MSQPMLKVEPLLAGRDNLIWLIPTGPEQFAVIDPGDADPVSNFLAIRNGTLSHILITHHHADHIGGVTTLRERHGGVVIGALADRHRLPPLDQAVVDGDRIPLGAAPGAQVIAVPGHTTGHVAFLVDDLLFSGDTLFGFGCGRLFEGNPAMMWESLVRLRGLPDATRLCAGHEYTLLNLGFVCQLEPERHDLTTLRAEMMALTDQGAFTLPHPLALEKRYNPFLRADDPRFAARLGLPGTSPVAFFAFLREQRNQY